jgi:hypothetical protein
MVGGRRLAMPLWVWVVGFVTLLLVVGLWFDRRFSGRDVKSHLDRENSGSLYTNNFYDGGGSGGI